MFRNYSYNNEIANTYRLNHRYQTYDYVKKMIKRYEKHDTCKASLWSVIEMLDEFVDKSDPDIGLPQIYHSFQTAEGLRGEKSLRDSPKDNKQLQLVGLIHDLGKVLSLEEFGGLEQWSVVGDTFPVGCKFSDKIVYHEYFTENEDYGKYDEYGVYSSGEGCGLDNVLMSFGHDWFMYDVLKYNNVKLDEENLRIIRYHSFYPFHTEWEYFHLANDADLGLIHPLLTFNDHDLYTKSDTPTGIDIDDLKPYYAELIDEFCPGKLSF